MSIDVERTSYLVLEFFIELITAKRDPNISVFPISAYVIVFVKSENAEIMLLGSKEGIYANSFVYSF